MLVRLGIDDTDSPRAMCTTYVGFRLVEELSSRGFRLLGLPRLIRLNPNCPYKTRGNCAIGLTVSCEGGEEGRLLELAEEVVARWADLEHEATEPAIVLLREPVPEELKQFSRRAVREILPVEMALALLERHGALWRTLKQGRIGLVGALAAAAYEFRGNSTFELLAYRERGRWGTPRSVDRASVFEMDARTQPYTFDNVDHTTGEVRITPHTPCPVLYGIRGIDPYHLLLAHAIVRISEPLGGWLIYETNQATDEHLMRLSISALRPYVSARIRGYVSARPRSAPGGHVFFYVRDESGEIRCAVYEPMKRLRAPLLELEVGDVVEVDGAYKPREGEEPTLNVERIRVARLVPKVRRLPPLCPQCNVSMKSYGALSGYRCRRCGMKLGPEAARVMRVERMLRDGIYEAPARARRHLSRPLARIY
jgi:tRNA(Ile2)-agmatinylcytidine synthase